MSKQEILNRLKPVLSAELYSAIETVFASEDKLQNVVAVLKDAFSTTEAPKVNNCATKYAEFYTDAREIREVQDWTRQ